MSQKFVIYSSNESAINDGKGFWAAGGVWVDCLSEAAQFDDINARKMPLATGGDAKFCALSDFPSV